jgi:hypothetical protein
MKIPSAQLVELRDKLKVAGEHHSLQDNVLVTGKQLCLDHGRDKPLPLTILITGGDNHWTVMWQVKLRSVIPNDPLFATPQSMFVLEEYRKLVEKNEKITFGEGKELPITYEVELNDEDKDTCQVELWATTRLDTTVELMFGLIQILFSFPQYDVTLTKSDVTDEYSLEISVPEKG